MCENPLITIVVPVYKVPYNLLHKCLDSIAVQTSKNFEALLIDDGSPDECGAICDQYAKKYSFMRVIHQANGGLSVVRNNGIDSAKGDWVCFVDGDDWIEPNTVEFAEQYVNDCPDGDVLIWDEYYDVDGVAKKNCFVKNAESGVYSYEGREKSVLYDMFFPRVYQRFENNLVDIGTANARLYRRAFLVENGIYNKPGLKRMQDNVFNMWVFDKAHKVYYQCQRLYHYTFNEQAATQKYAPNNVDTMYFLLESMEEFVSQCDNKEDCYQRLCSRFLRIFGEMFKLNYANPKNPNSLDERVRQAAADFGREKFRQVIELFDDRGQSKKTCFIHRMLKNKQYKTLILYYSLSIRTRKIRLKLRAK